MVILGHIDHGKTKLLDFIRKTKVAEKEAGGITQHIGAYEIEHKGKKITFIDTPGHEAFSNIRSRGAKAADIAVLVVAAEEGVKPQTKEAIQHVKEAGIFTVAAINKIDKPNANSEKVKAELKKEGVVVESLGGDIPSVNISAKEGTGIDELLEIIQLVAELAELKADPTGRASGVVLESHLDSRRGPTASLLVTDGTLHNGEWICSGDTYGKVKTMEDFLLRPLAEACPSQPVVVTGIYKIANTGDLFQVFESEKKARECVASYGKKAKQIEGGKKEVQVEHPTNEGENVFSIILKADVLGSLEAIKASLLGFGSDKVKLKIVKSEVGDINETDIKFAFSAGATIYGFKVSAAKIISELAKRHGVKIFISEVIYELIDQTKKGMSLKIPPDIVRKDIGILSVLALFGKRDKGRIIGGKVISGKVKKSALADVFRGEGYICNGRIQQLQRNKKDMEEVSRGEECGILFHGDCDIKEGDELKIYEEEYVKKDL